METVPIEKPGVQLSVVAREPAHAEVRVLIRAIHRGNREALLELLSLIKAAGSEELAILQSRASQEIHGKNVLHDMWDIIQTSGLSQSERYRLLDFLDAHRFRMRNEHLRWVLANVSSC